MAETGGAEQTVRPQLRIAGAGGYLALLPQGGVWVNCLTGIPLTDLLERELQLPSTALQQLDVYFLNGMPVDDPQNTLVPDQARLALAGALPGMAGLAMRSNSPLAGMRPGITLQAQQSAPRQPKAGRLELVLYSKALDLLGTWLLRRGVLVEAARLAACLKRSSCGNLNLDGTELNLEQCHNLLAQLDPQTLIALKVEMAEKP